MTNLFISRYPTNEKRQKELDYCLEQNLKLFDQVFVFSEGGWYDGRVKCYNVSGRMTFEAIFKAVNQLSNDSDINVIANADIWIDGLIKPFKQQCFALTRYENGKLLDRIDSQDTWIFNGHIQIPKYCKFWLGRPGCDNRIARELMVTGYTVINPCLSIKTHHVHAGEKSYDNLTARVPPPYLKLAHTSL